MLTVAPSMMQQEQSLQQEDDTLTNPLLQGAHMIMTAACGLRRPLVEVGCRRACRHPLQHAMSLSKPTTRCTCIGHAVHADQPTSANAAAPAVQTVEGESIAETREKVAHFVRTIRPLLLAWLTISVVFAAFYIAYLVAYSGSLRPLIATSLAINGLTLAVVGIGFPVIYHIPAAYAPLCKGECVWQRIATHHAQSLVVRSGGDHRQGERRIRQSTLSQSLSSQHTSNCMWHHRSKNQCGE
jgi:hypothetical protein